MNDLFSGTTVTKTMTTETAHRLTEYVGKCASIHGHSYRWEVTAALEKRDTLANGISIDFGDLKKAMREAIYDPYDHALVLADNDPIILNSPHLLNVAADGSEQKVVAFPGNPTAENFARNSAAHIQSILDAQALYPGRQQVLRVRVWETENSYGQWTVYED